MRHYLIVLKRKILHIFGYKIGYHKDNKFIYFSIPSLGIKGRRPGTDIETRMQGLEEFIDKNGDNINSTLDIGCAEGLISLELHKRGISTVHGFDLQDISIKIANQLFKETTGNFFFGQADFLKWENFEKKYSNVLQDKYDMVLFLSVYGHMSRINKTGTNEVLLALTKKSGKYLAIRSDEPYPEEIILKEGFKKIYFDPAPNANKLTVYERQK